MTDWDRQQSRPRGVAYPQGGRNPGGRSGNGRGGGRPPDGGGRGNGTGAPGANSRQGRGAPLREPMGVRDGVRSRRSAAEQPPPGRRRSGGRGPGSAEPEPAWDAPHEPQRMRGRRTPDAGGDGGGRRGPGRRTGPEGPGGRSPRGPGGPSDAAAEAEAPARGRRSWRQRILLGVGIVLVLLMFAGAGVAYYLYDKWRGIDTFDDDLTTDVAAAGEPENFLLIGSDQRESETPRSDTIIIMRVDPETHAAQALSFQRDLMVEIAGTGQENKINSSFNGGAAGVVDTIRHNFGIPIHHVVEIDFDGFRRLVDQVGGLELWINQAVRDTSSGLFIEQLGCVNLNGDQALAFARSRKMEYMEDGEWVYDPTSDHGRVLRQQILIQQALSKAVHESDVTDVAGLLSIIEDTVTLSDGLKDPGKLRELSSVMQGFSDGALTMYAMPILEVGDAGSADLYPDWDTADPILNVFRGLPANEISPRRVTVDVQNGSGEADQAVNVAGALDTIGFQVGETGDSSTPMEATTIYHAPGEEAYANRVARHLDSGAQLAVDEALESGHVRLVTGTDFSRLHEEPTPLEETDAAPPPPTDDAGAAGAGSATPETTAATTATTAAPPEGGGGGGGETSSTTLPPPPERIGHAVGEPPAGQECG
jgi:polyisoprenyl-teichoic acid--peptidoglycan teichoic acid transferase